MFYFNLVCEQCVHIALSSSYRCSGLDQFGENFRDDVFASAGDLEVSDLDLIPNERDLDRYVVTRNGVNTARAEAIRSDSCIVYRCCCTASGRDTLCDELRLELLAIEERLREIGRR